jgi:hypothetical protein
MVFVQELSERWQIADPEERQVSVGSNTKNYLQKWVIVQSTASLI